MHFSTGVRFKIQTQVLALVLALVQLLPSLVPQRAEAASLSIAKGVVVRSGLDGQLVVRDTLTADGATFTSSQATPAPGDWLGMVFYSSSTGSSLKGSTIEYAGAGAEAALHLQASNPALNGAVVRNNAGTGIRLDDGASPTIADAVISGNAVGIDSSTGAKPIVQNSFLAGNLLALRNNDPTISITATGNWWGDPSGPLDSSDDRASGGLFNPTGLGSPVSDGVVYTSWAEVVPLLGTDFAIAQGGVTVNPDITLNLACTTCTDFRASEDPSFSTVQFQPFTSSAPFILSSSDSLKTVYVQFRTSTGNTSQISKQIMLDRTLPTVQNLAISPAGPLQAGSATFTVTFSESMKTSVQPTVTFTGPSTRTLNGSWQGDNKTWVGTYAFTAATGDGNYSVAVSNAQDLAGNVMDIQRAAGTFILDTVSPTVTITSPVTGLGSNKTPQLAYTVSEGAVIVKVDGAVVNKTSGMNLDSLSDGSHTVLIQATDTSGNSGSASVTFNVDSKGPVIASSIPASNAMTNSAATISVTLSDGAGVDLQGSLDGAVVKDASGAVVTGTWSVSGPAVIFNPATQLAEGKYTVTIYPVDTLGNKGSVTFSFTMDRAPPTVQSLALSPASPVRAGTVTFTVTFSEAMDTSVQPSVTFAGTAITGAWQGDKKTWKGTYPFTALTGDGTYTVTVKGAKDLAGNTMADQAAGSFTLDTTAPSAPTVAAVTTPTKTATQLLSGAKPADTAIVINGTVRAALNSAATWSYSYPLAEGANTLTITARDAAGNDSQAFTPAPLIILDTTPPLFTIDTYTSPSPTVTQTISGKKEAGCVVKMNGTTIFDATDQNATWSYSITVTDGITNHLVFTAADALGNTTTKSIDILCDTAPPQALAVGMLVADGSGKGSEVTLTWPSYTQPADLAYYRIYSSATDFPTVTGLTPIATVNKGTKTYKVTGLPQGSTLPYYFAVVPVSASGNADATIHTANAVPTDTVAPEDATGLSAVAGFTAVDGNSVTLSWTPSANSTGDLADQIVYIDAGQGYDAGTPVGKSTITFIRKGLNDATLYKFKITSKDTLGHESSGTVITAVTRLANPAGLTATPGSGKAVLSWNAVASPYVKLYNIYRITSDSAQTDVSSMSLIKSQTGTTFTDTGLANGTTYQYAVTTLNTSLAEKTTVQSVSALPRSDTTGPVISGVNITPNQVITAPVTISAAAADAESAMDRIEIAIDGVLVKTATGSSLSWLWNVVTGAIDGNHTIKISAYDGPGNLTEQTIPVVVSLAAPAPPVVTGHSVTATTPACLVTVNGTSALDTTVSLKVNGVPVGQPAQVTAAGTFTFTGIQLVEGSNTLAVKAADRGGESPYGANYLIAVDTGAPSAPTGLAVKAIAGGSLQFSWQAGTGEVPSGFNLYEANAAFTSKTDSGVKKSNTTAPITYLLKEYIPADDNPRYYAVTALDGAGNESPISNLVTVASDRLAPTVTAISFTDANDAPAASNTFGPGQVKVAFTVSEPLSEAPFLSLEGQSGSPIVITTGKLDDTHYAGNFSLDATSPQGATVYKFSGKDVVGNRGSGQGTGITIDVQGPAATITAPLTLLKTTVGPLTVSFTLDEPSTATPTLSLKAADGAAAPVTGLASTDGGLHWSGTLDPSALAEGRAQFVFADAKDRFGNTGTTVKSGLYITLYKTTPPAPAIPFGLVARAGKGGSIALAWATVTDAQGYNIYRQGQGDQTPVLVAPIATGTAVAYSDTPPADGSYGYSISSVGLLGSESARSDTVSAVSDRTPPPVPTGLLLAISGNGVTAAWDAAAAPAEIPYAYRLYRADSAITDITGLTSLVTVRNTPATDASPTKAKRFYAITALDALGNESAPATAPEITFPVAPVADLTLTIIDDGKPSLSWSSGEPNLQGFYIYRNGARINQTPTTSTTYSDGYYSGGTVSYGVSAVDSNGTEGPVKEVSLPLLTIALKDGTVLHRGVLENVALIASIPGDATSNLAIDAVNVKIGALPESTETGPFTVTPGTPLEIDKVAATEATAPPQEAVVVTAVIHPAPGATIKMSKSSLASVIGSGTALEIFNDPLVRGTTAKVRIKVNNLGTARSEFLTSENNGPTSHVRITLRDQDGNALAQGNLDQRTGAAVVNSGAYATARLEPGDSFLSDPVTFTIPSSAPFKVSLEAAIDNTWYHYGQDDQVTAPGLKQSLATSIADVSYTATAQTDKAVYKQGEPVVITGAAVSTANSQPMPMVPVKIGVSVNGFDRFFTVNTDNAGSFAYTFTPGASEAGSYSVWAIHPDLSDRSAQARFSIIGMQVSPTLANITILKGQSYDIPVSLRNLGGSDLTALTFTTSGSSGITAGVVNLGDDKLTAGENQAITLRVTAAASAPDTGYATLDITTAEGLGDRVAVNLTLVTAIPIIATSPSYIDTGIVRATQRVASFTISNTGMDTLRSARIEGPSTPWLSLTIDKNIGDIGVNKSMTVGVLISPDATVAQGVYNDRLVIYSDNHIPYNYNIQVTVTSNAVGSVLFYILDELNQKVPNATITMQNQSVTELIYTLKTDATGTDPSVTDIPEGRYSFTISAPNHKSTNGSFVVIPGVWITVPSLMEYNLVNIEWSVTPVVIEDRYDITITQTFVTNVPAPVLVTEPPSVTLPDMTPGQVFNGEFKVSNYGLVALNNMKIAFPKSFGELDIEVFATIPDTLAAMQKVTVPYRITRRQSTAAVHGLPWNRENLLASVVEEVKSFGGSCFSAFSIDTSGDYQPCPTIPQSVGKSAPFNVSMPSGCPSGASAGSVSSSPPIYSGGGSPGGGQPGGGTWMPGAVPSLVGDGDECGNDVPKCAGDNCPKKCTNSVVNLGQGNYEDSVVDIDVKANGFPVTFERNYTSKWTTIGYIPPPPPPPSVISGGGGGGGGGTGVGGVVSMVSFRTSFRPTNDPENSPQAFGWTSPWFAKVSAGGLGLGISYFDGAGNIINFNYDGSPAQGATRYIKERGLKLVRTISGIQIIEKNGLRRNFANLSAGAAWYYLSSIEDPNGNKLIFNYDSDKKLVSIDTATGTRVITFTYNGKYITKITDRDGREVNYSVDANGRLTEVTGIMGEKSSYEYDAVSSYYRLVKKTDAEGNVTQIQYKPGQIVVSKVIEPGGGERSFEYDFKGLTFYTTDTRGATTVYKANMDGKATSITTNGQLVKSIRYLDDRSETITDGAGNVTTIRKNEFYDPVSIVDGEGKETRIEYNQYWKISKVIDPLGNTTQLNYDDKQNIITLLDALGNITTAEYDTFGNMTKLTKGEGANASIYSLEYDGRGNVSKVTDPLGNATTFAYDQYGHLSGITDANGNRTNVTCDLSDHPLLIENPLGNKKKYSYDRKGNVTTVTDELNRTVSFTYDFKGRVTSVTDPFGNKTALIYDGEGNVVQKKDLAGTADEQLTSFTYDIFNRLETVTDSLNNLTRYDYTGSLGCPTCFGNSTTMPTKITDPLGSVFEYNFNKAGKLMVFKNPLAYLTNVARDASGKATAIQDANGNTSHYQYDALWRITKQTDANGGINSFTYDEQGNLATLTDPNGYTATFDYDLAGRKIKETRPMGQVTEYTYYLNGLVKTVKDGKGQVTTYTYDVANRLTQITYADGKKDTFSYDAAGNMTNYAKEGVAGTLTYDELGRKLSETVNYGAFSKTYSYTYDAIGNKATFTSPEGKVYNYTYNKNNQPIGISFDGRTIGLTYEWDRLTKAQLPNGVATDYQYNASSWLSAISTKQAAATLASSSYGFDKVGNITSKTTEQGNNAYSYDPTYQLTSATSPVLPTEGFSYDKTGNRMSATIGADSNNYTTNANNEMTAVDGISYTYDANGNTTSKAVSGQSTTFIYNSADRLETVQLSDGRTATCTYDPFGRRIKKDVAGVVTFYLYSNEGLIGEYDAAGNLKKGYGWKPDMVWGTAPVFMIENGRYFYYHNDTLGAPQKISDDTGTVVWSATYTAFGKAIVDTASTVANNLRLPGQYYDEETGLHYNWNRYYDPETGRFTQTDPAGSFTDANLYRYAYNNPALIVDPLGDFGVVGAGIGAVIGGVSGYMATGTWQGAVGGAVIGGAAGFFGQFGTSLAAGALMGVLVGAGSDLAWQMLVEGKSLKCVDKGQVALSGLLGGVTGGFGNWVDKGMGPLKNWIRIGPSYSKTLGQQIDMSIRWGASPIGKGKYLNQIVSPTLRDLNQWLRNQRFPFGGWRSVDPGHFHLW